MRGASSSVTRDAVFAMFRPFYFGNILMILSILVLVIIRPKADNPGIYRAIGLVGLLMFTALPSSLCPEEDGCRDWGSRRGRTVGESRQVLLLSGRSFSSQNHPRATGYR